MIPNLVPNIFRLATKELTQDSFFAWLMQWADQTHANINPNLNRTAQDFVRMLIGRTDTYEVIKVVADRQWQNIDLWAEVNDEYFICIEDKTNTGAHSNQLADYKEKVFKRYKGKPHILKFIYLKTGNESAYTLKLIQEQEEYVVIDRKAVLQILDIRPVNNDIFNDFRSYLKTIEELTASFTSLKAVKNKMSAAEGFYINLQKLIPETTDWKYVSNPTGGFLGFWYHWVKTPDFQLYIQIENRIRNQIQVKIKIGNWKPKIDTLNLICAELKELALKYDLQVVKPSKYRLGNTSTLAIVANALPIIATDEIDMKQLVVNLQNLQALLDTYALTYT